MVDRLPFSLERTAYESDLVTVIPTLRRLKAEASGAKGQPKLHRKIEAA